MTEVTAVDVDDDDEEDGCVPSDPVVPPAAAPCCVNCFPIQLRATDSNNLLKEEIRDRMKGEGGRLAD